MNPTQNGLNLNVDLCHRVMRTKTVRDVMDELEIEVRAEMFNRPAEEVDSEVVRRVNQELKGAMVMTTYNRRAWRIDGVDFTRNLDSSMPLKDGKTTTFRRYYADVYDIKLSDEAARKPGLLVNIPRKAAAKGSQKNDTYLVPELCCLTGVTDAMRSSTKVMRALADLTRASPSKRVEQITALISRLLCESPVSCCCRGRLTCVFV